MCPGISYPQHVGTTHAHMRQVFPHVRLHLGFVPCYPSVWSYCLGSEAPLAVAVEAITRRCHDRALRPTYFTPELYQASVVLPQFVLHLLGH
jgi:spermidine synthase